MNDLEPVLALVGFGAPPPHGGGGMPHGGGHPHGGGFHPHGGGGFRRFRGGGPFFEWPWFWGPNVYIEPASCSWMPPAGPVPSDVVTTLAKIPFQAGWRAAFVGGGWWGEQQSPHAYFVCVVSENLITGLYGVGLEQALAERAIAIPKGEQHMGPVWPVGMPERGASHMGPVWPVGVPQRARAGFRGLGMDYTEHPTPGNYHVNGAGVILRALPEYTSKAIATLQNGENVYVFGDVETDPAYYIKQDDTVAPNSDESGIVGIDYVRVGTQTHGAGWIAMPYIESGAGKMFGQPQPQPSPSPSPTPMPSSKGMSVVSKVLLGGAIGATIAGGGYFLWRALQESRPRHFAPA